jgi:hypothetical protein
VSPVADYARSVRRECGRVMRAVRDGRASAGVDGGSFLLVAPRLRRAMLMTWPSKIAIKGDVVAVVVIHAVASMDGCIADADDEVGRVVLQRRRRHSRRWPVQGVEGVGRLRPSDVAEHRDDVFWIKILAGFDLEIACGPVIVRGHVGGTWGPLTVGHRHDDRSDSGKSEHRKWGSAVRFGSCTHGEADRAGRLLGGHRRAAGTGAAQGGVVHADAMPTQQDHGADVAVHRHEVAEYRYQSGGGDHR